MICPICGIDSRKLPLTAVHRHALPEPTPELLAILKEPFTMAGPITSCEHVRAGAPVAGSFRGRIGTDDAMLKAGMDPNITMQVCSNCLAQGTGGGAGTVKGGYSVGDAGRYFGSKLDR